MLTRRNLLSQAGVAMGLAVGGAPFRAWSQAAAPSAMIVHRSFPLNAEPRPNRLAASFITPESDFYVRCHGTIPKLAADGYRLRIDGEGVTTPLTLSLDELRSRFPLRTVTAVMQCAGNRRADLIKVKHVSGDPWGPGAIGNAEWAGVALADVLRAAGVRGEVGLHAAFDCHDEVEAEGERFRYGASIPIAKAMSLDTILAFAMNGAPLTAAHGFPLRVVAPGYAGARSAKWIAAITVQDRPSGNVYQQKEYKLFPPGVSKDTVDYATGHVINDMPLNAAICEPSEGVRVSAGPIAVRGYAIATGRPIVRVDLSSDNGRTWRQADLDRRPDAPWSWTLWRTRMELPRGEHELVVRAWDGAGSTQPSSPAEVWNFPGYLSAAWHRVKIISE